MVTYVLYFIGIFLCIVAMIATTPYKKDYTVDGLNVCLIVLESLSALLSIIFVFIAKCMTCYDMRKTPVRILVNYNTNQQQIGLNTISNGAMLDSSDGGGGSAFPSSAPAPPLYSMYPNPSVDEPITDENPPMYNSEKFPPYPREFMPAIIDTTATTTTTTTTTTNNK